MNDTSKQLALDLHAHAKKAAEGILVKLTLADSKGYSDEDRMELTLYVTLRLAAQVATTVKNRAAEMVSDASTGLRLSMETL